MCATLAHNWWCPHGLVMHFATTLGIVGGLALVLIVAVFSTENPALLWNPLGILVVVGGTIAASLVAFPAREVLRVVKVLAIVLRNEKLYTDDDVTELTSVAKLAFRKDIQKTERAIHRIKNPFLRTGAQLVVDGASLEDIVDVLAWRIEKLKSKERAEANIFRAMASFAPAFGMAGTLLGLVNMLSGLGTDVSVIGLNLAIALTTTLYGIVAANVILKPVAMKLEHRTELRVELMHTILEGVCLMAQRRSPSAIRETMAAYTAENGDEIRDPKRARDKGAPARPSAVRAGAK